MEPSASERLWQLESDNRRLRRLLAQDGAPAHLRQEIRNTLAMVRSVIRRSAETSTTVDGYVAHLDGRLDAILRVQVAIVGSSDEGLDLHSLIADELLVHLAREGEQVEIAGPDLKLQPRAAELLALCFHELATNAIKFGALTEPEGRVAVTWTTRDGRGPAPHVDLCWHETGCPISPVPPHRGFGRIVLEQMLAYQLDAETSFGWSPAGLRCAIRFPMPAEIGTLVVGHDARQSG